MLRSVFSCRGVLSVRAVRHQSRAVSPYILSEISKFDARCSVEKAHTPPGSWYTEPELEQLESDTVFSNNWVAVAGTHHLKKPGDYITGFVGKEPYLISKDDESRTHYFYNLCRHHGTLLCDQNSGCTDEFECPYHAWKYSLNGRLTQAKKLRGIENFKAKDYGLLRFNGTSFLDIIWLHKNPAADPNKLHERLNPVMELLNEGDTKLTDLRHVQSQRFSIPCNWKVAIDNYVDGAYHVPTCHKDLNSLVNIDGYTTEVYDHYSMQACRGKESSSRVSDNVCFIHIYPNVFINKYGKWLDVNYVMPTGPETCDVLFDWYFNGRELERLGALESDLVIKQGVRDSMQVQEEDNTICERVQKGMRSQKYQFGRYAPQIEHAMYDFHCKLYSDYTSPQQQSTVSTNHRKPVMQPSKHNPGLNGAPQEPVNQQQASFCTLTGVPLTNPFSSQSLITNQNEDFAQQIHERTNHTPVIPAPTNESAVKICDLTGTTIDAGPKSAIGSKLDMCHGRNNRLVCTLTGLSIEDN